jgi:DNA-binding ferritin-like protein
MEELASLFFHSRTQAHVFHLGVKGPGAFAAHSALNTYYDEIVGLTDSFVEGYQGKYGIITGYANVALLEYESCEEIINYFTILSMYISKTREMVCPDSYLQNVIDEIVMLINSTIYKLKYLK